MPAKPTKQKHKNGAHTLGRVAAPLVSTFAEQGVDAHAQKGGAPARVTINRAYKMYVGGAFVRSESGRYFQVKSDGLVKGADPRILNMPRGSRKDVRDAVLAAKNAEAGWAGRTAFNRGQILEQARRDDGVAPR